jgi:hypothetical protein
MSAILNGKRLIILSEKGKGSARGKRSQRAPTTKLGVLTASK